MKKLLCTCLVVPLGLSVNAASQFHFYATNLPSQTGTYNCSYFSTNSQNVAAMLTLTTNSSGGLIPPGTEPTWDFSQAQQASESILRTDIISPAAGMDGSSFPDAGYAEQDAVETMTYTNQTAWRYYGITNQGRLYYGSYVADTAADGLAVFAPATLDVPATVTNGQTWTRATAWNTTVYTIFGPYPIYYEFSAAARVDAQGTLILPNLGAFEALRVHETHGYTGLLDGLYPEEIVTNQYYYWLVPGLGVAAQITIYGSNQVDGETPPFTNSVERMYSASYYTNPPPISTQPTIGNLHIRLQSGTAALSWIPFTNSTSYQVQASGSLTRTNWQLLGLTSSTNWSDILNSTQRFYRVVGLP